MADTDRGFDLEVWSLATFRTVSFVLLVALALHLHGSLRARLASLNTLVGSGLFLLLWATTLGATRFGRRCLKRAETDPHRDASRLEATIVAGAVNGVAIFAGLAIVFIVAAIPSVLAADTVAAPLGRLSAVIVFAAFGGCTALAIGGFVGLAYGLIEALLLGAADALLQLVK